jgi:hypothetical protein
VTTCRVIADLPSREGGSRSLRFPFVVGPGDSLDDIGMGGELAELLALVGREITSVATEVIGAAIASHLRGPQQLTNPHLEATEGRGDTSPALGGPE